MILNSRIFIAVYCTQHIAMITAIVATIIGTLYRLGAYSAELTMLIEYTNIIAIATILCE